MEFEQNAASPDLVDEATRIAAGNRQLTMQPVHDDIIAEDEPDDLVAARHIIGAPIANIESDTETTVAIAVAAKQEKANHHVALASSIAVMLVVGTVTVISFLSR